MAKPLNRETIISKIATIEWFVAQLKADQQSASVYRDNVLVQQATKSAREELDNAIGELFSGDLEMAWRSCSIAWLHFCFGRQVVDAEEVEHLAGESHYLELKEDWKAKAEAKLTTLEMELIKMRGAIKELAEKAES